VGLDFTSPSSKNTNLKWQDSYSGDNMASIQSRNTIHHLSGKVHLTNSRNHSSLNVLVSVIILCGLVTIMAMTTLDALDRSIYPGCKVISQEDNILFIKLDAAINTGSDMGYARSSRLIQRICMDGYTVRVLNKFWSSKPISLQQADELVALNGGYGESK